MKKLKFGEKPEARSKCLTCKKRNELRCKFAALNGIERSAVVTSCRNYDEDREVKQ